MDLSGLNEIVLIKHPEQGRSHSRCPITFPYTKVPSLTPLPSWAPSTKCRSSLSCGSDSPCVDAGLLAFGHLETGTLVSTLCSFSLGCPGPAPREPLKRRRPQQIHACPLHFSPTPFNRNVFRASTPLPVVPPACQPSPPYRLRVLQCPSAPLRPERRRDGESGGEIRAGEPEGFRKKRSKARGHPGKRREAEGRNKRELGNET